MEAAERERLAVRTLHWPLTSAVKSSCHGCFHGALRYIATTVPITLCAEM